MSIQTMLDMLISRDADPPPGLALRATEYALTNLIAVHDVLRFHGES